jgi:tetratricopeptide (TPR) repeat protein
LSLFASLDDRWGVAAIHYHLGLALHRAGRLEAALEAYERSLTESRRVGRVNTIGYALANMGHAALLLGDLERAQRHFAQAHATARELGADPADPQQNVRAGAQYLRRMLDRFGGDIDLALAAYNAGPTAVDRAGGAPGLETVAYVANVRARAATLVGCA